MHVWFCKLNVAVVSLSASGTRGGVLIPCCMCYITSVDYIMSYTCMLHYSVTL